MLPKAGGDEEQKKLDLHWSNNNPSGPCIRHSGRLGVAKVIARISDRNEGQIG
jgi:hypothetical protein